MTRMIYDYCSWETIGLGRWSFAREIGWLAQLSVLTWTGQAVAPPLAPEDARTTLFHLSLAKTKPNSDRPAGNILGFTSNCLLPSTWSLLSALVLGAFRSARIDEAPAGVARPNALNPSFPGAVTWDI